MTFLFLKSNNLSFNWDTYALTGNIVRENKHALSEEEIKELINFFLKNIL